MITKVDWHQKLFLSCAVITGATTLFLIGFIFYVAFPVLQKEGISFITGSLGTMVHLLTEYFPL